MGSGAAFDGEGFCAAGVVSELSDEQLEIAQVLFGLPGAAGFALAGGSALVALQVVDRETRDIDAFVAARPGEDPGDVRALARMLSENLQALGWSSRMVMFHATFCRLLVTRDEIEVEVDLAVDSPPLFAVETVNNLPVLTAPDLAARKILTILDRSEGRDFSDLWALSRRLGKAACLEWARQLDQGVEPEHVAVAFGRIDRLDDNEFPVPISSVAEIRTWYLNWTEELDTT